MNEATTQADRIIAKFGGINPMARALGHKNASTVQGWKERGSIPQQHHQDIFDTALKMDVEVEPSDFLVVSAAQ